MNNLWSILVIWAAASAAAAQPGPSPIEGPSSGRLVFSPVTLATGEASPSLESEADWGRMMTVPALPRPEPFRGRGGRVSLLRIASPGAAAYRLYFREFHLPPGARLFLYGFDTSGALTTVFGPYQESGPAGDGEFRSRIVAGAVAVIEIHNSEGEQWPFRLERVNRIDGVTLAGLRAAEDPSLQENESERAAVRGETRPCLVRGERRMCEAVNGKLLFEGDIVIADDDADELADGKSEPGSRPAVGISGDKYRWPSGKIPYRIHISMYIGNTPDRRVTGAIEYWNQRFPGMLVRVTDQRDSLTFRRTTDATCHTPVGHRGDIQYLDVANGCSMMTVVHEIAHAAGLWHEQSREDRNQFITVYLENVLAGKEHNFEQHIADGFDIGAYDYGSLMHYGRRALSRNGLPTIETIPAGIPIGQNTALSAGDIAGVRKVQCNYVLTPAMIAAPAAGGDYTIRIEVASYCPWTAVSSGLVEITSTPQGTGNGSIDITARPNYDMRVRGSIVTIGDRTVVVTHAAAR